MTKRLVLRSPREEALDYLETLAEGLDRAERTGDAADQPEGSRYITMSDTLAGDIALRLRDAIKVLKDA